MNKIFGKKGDFAYLRDDGSRTVVSYNQQPVEGDTDNCTWQEVYLYKRQQSLLTLQTVKKAIIDDINAQTDQRILSGFTYEGKPVWLSEENQRNFSEAQRVAQMLPTQILPVTFKLGEQEDGTPVYHEFQTAEELTGFYLQTVAFIQQQLAEGWQQKDALDFSPYEQYFPAAQQEKAPTSEQEPANEQ